MELTKNIFFNTDKLIENTSVKISYTGKFFQDGCEDVFIHYGFGLNWDGLNEVKMERSELGFQAELDLCGKDTFNFCFKNDLNEWDNNDGQNYIFELEKKVVDTQYQENNGCKIIRPRGIVLYGSGKELNIEKQKFLRILNSSYHNVQILTYQQLFEKAKNIMHFIKER